MNGDNQAFVSSIDRLMARLVYVSRKRGPVGKVAGYVLKLFGIDIPRTVQVGPGLRLPHATTGLVLHPYTTIGNDVTIYHGVTIGRSDVWRHTDELVKVTIGDGVLLGAGATIMASAGREIVVGDGAVLGAGSVLTKSTGPGEVWAGVPARRVRAR